VHPAQADERGSFEHISFALLLIRALDRRWSGTMIVERPDTEAHVLQLERGLVSRVLVPDSYARLGEIVVEAGVVTAPELEATLAKSGLLGEALIAQKLIDLSTLQRALVLQILKRMVRIFGFPTATRWSFSTDTTAFAGKPAGVRVDTLRVLWAGVSAFGEMGAWMPTTMRHIGLSPFRVRADVNLRRFGFTGDARRLARVVRDERCTLQNLAGRAITPEEVCRQLVYVLAITRYLEFSPVGGDDSAPSTNTSSVDELPSISDEATSDDAASDPPPSSGREAESPRGGGPLRVAKIRLRRVAVQRTNPHMEVPPGARSSEDARVSSEPTSRPSQDVKSTPPDAGAALRAEVTSRLGRLDRETPWSLLDIDPSDISGKNEEEITDIVWSAYERATNRWHPDRCAPELREGIARIHTAVSVAFMALADPDERAKHFGPAPVPLSPSPLPPNDRPGLPMSSNPPTSGGTPHVTGPPVPSGQPRRLPSELPATMRSSNPEGSPRPPASDLPHDDTPAHPASFERAVEPAHTPIELHARALSALSEQRHDEALALCRSASDASPTNPDYQATAVWIRACMDRPDLKVLVLELDDLLLDHPEHIAARFYRGVLRRRLGADALARQDFERVLAAVPEHAGARAQLADLARPSERRR
jgi:hypothetical protein